MALTPMDIHNKEFGHSFRGYTVEEVNEFLDRVAKDFEPVSYTHLDVYKRQGRQPAQRARRPRRSPHRSPAHL